MNKQLMEILFLLKYYLSNFMARAEIYFCTVLGVIVISFPVRALYTVAELSGCSVHLVEGWILMLNNSWLQLYLTFIFLFVLSKMPFNYGSPALIAIRVSHVSMYYAPLVFAFLLAIFMLVVEAVLSFIMLIPIAYTQNNWSVPVQLMENVHLQNGGNIAFMPPFRLMQHVKPWNAFMITFMQQLLMWITFSIVMFIACVYGKRAVGTIMNISIVLIGLMFMFYGDHYLLILLSPFHHSMPGYVYYSGHTDLIPLGIATYFTVLNTFLMQFCSRQMRYGTENILNESN